MKIPRNAKYKRMVRRNNYKDPIEDSEHYKVYKELKAIREDIEQNQFERIKKRRDQYETSKIDEKQNQELDKQNTEYMVENIVNDEISK